MENRKIHTNHKLSYDNRMNRKGSLLIVVLLIMFAVLLFIIAAVHSVNLLNKSQMNENTTIKQTVNKESAIKIADNLAMFGYERSNLRGDYTTILNGKDAVTHISFDYLSPGYTARKYLLFDTVVTTDGKAPIAIRSFKPCPLFVYSHFVMNPLDNLGDINIREKTSGVIRANKINNDFTYITGDAIKDCGKPYIYLQELKLQEYIDCITTNDIFIDKSEDIELQFIDGESLRVLPDNVTYDISALKLLVVRNNGHLVRISGKDIANEFTSINLEHNITFITDSPIVINSGINGIGDFLFISLFIDTNIQSAISFDINAYINCNLYFNNGTVNNSSNYFGVSDGVVSSDEVNKIVLKSIFVCPNGSFGFVAENYVSPVYNIDTANSYYIHGGIIEKTTHYSLKHFDMSLPAIYPHIEIVRNDNYFNINADAKFDFIAPPIAENLFSFSRKYF